MSTPPTPDECPSLNNLTSNPNIITIENIKSLLLNSYNRSVGAVVEITCYRELKLYGNQTVICQNDLKWTNVPRCDYVTQPERETILIISLAAVCGFLLLLTLIGILISMVRKVKKKGEDYKHMQNGSLYHSSSSISNDSRHAYTNEAFYGPKGYPPGRHAYTNEAFYGPKGYPPGRHAYTNEAFYGPKGYPPGTKRNDNIHMNPVTLPQTKSQFDVMETALPRLPSSTSLDAPSNLQKKKYDFEEFNLYAFRQGRDPFLWRPVVTNFDN